jgi:prepilin-type N-terminal cleavage/methylation domain-containing protein
MVRTARKGFTLVELLIVIIIIGLLAALLLPAIVKALCLARQGTCEHLIDNLTQAAKGYEFDMNAYPTGTGTGSDTLASALSVKGPKKLAYFEFLNEMIDTSSLGILNPVHGSSSDLVARILYYRNNVAGGAAAGGPTVHFTGSFDLWGAGCSYAAGAGNSSPNSWECNNWE